jgi:hypothetical protein
MNGSIERSGKREPLFRFQLSLGKPSFSFPLEFPSLTRWFPGLFPKFTISFPLFSREKYGNGFWEIRTRFPKRRFVSLSRFPNLLS